MNREAKAREGGGMAWAAGLLLLVVLGGFQISSLARWGPVRVDALLVAAMAWAALSGPRRGLVFGMASGMIEDFLVGGGFRFTVLRAVMGLVAGTVRPVLNVRQVAIVVPLVGAATLAQEAVLGLVYQNWPRFLAIWLPAMLANMLISWPIYLVVRAIWRPGRAPVPGAARRA